MAGSGVRKRPAREVPRLTDEESIRIGEAHLTALVQRQRVTASAGVVRMPRTRALGRRLRLWGIWVHELVRGAWRWMWDARHRLGRWKARVLLLRPSQTFNWWAWGAALLAVVMGLLTFWPWSASWHTDLQKAVTGAFFGSAVVGLTVTLWTDLVRCPYALRRIRRTIMKEPESMLLTNLGARKTDVVPRNDPLKVVPRTEFFYEVLPGVLSRGHKDVQIVVGEPGAGKTTALLDVATLLAKLGIVPVLVPLRTERVIHLVDLAKERFCKQVEEFVRSGAEAEVMWAWLRRRRRVAILADDIDQIGPDGERGFILRQTLLEAATYGLPIIVTARPAGVPAGIAASAISLDPLDEHTILKKVIDGAKDDPGFKPGTILANQQIEDWIREGRLVEIPFYLELLAQLAAAGECPKLPDARSLSTEAERRGRYRPLPDGRYEWNPQWVRYRLLDLFDDRARKGLVRPWLGIGTLERDNALDQLRGAALGSLVATGIAAKAASVARTERERERARPQRQRLDEFISSDDRRDLITKDDAFARGHPHRKQVSVHEVTDTGERLRILDRDAEGNLQFRHRIMQAYLAGCCLAERLHNHPEVLQEDAQRNRGESGEPDWIELLLDAHHPEKLTANMALTFAALFADDKRHAEHSDEKAAWTEVGRGIVSRLVKSARHSKDRPARRAESRVTEPAAIVSLDSESRDRLSHITVTLLKQDGDDRAKEAIAPDDLDPRHFVDPDVRKDPDDALIKLTTAADIARAIQDRPETQAEIVTEVTKVRLTTRWTKLDAIRAIAALDVQSRWECIWQFACDPDYVVRRAASDALQADATRAYGALKDEFHVLLLRAAARSAFDLDITRPQRPPAPSGSRAILMAGHGDTDGGPTYDITTWTDEVDIPRLRALGWVLPSILSGLKEDPSMHVALGWQGRHNGSDDGAGPHSEGRAMREVEPLGDEAALDVEPVNDEEFAAYARSARIALERLVALTFEGGHHDLEDSLAQGFKGDAGRHALSRTKPGGARWIAGPGWVASNWRLVSDVGLNQAESWYARMLLYQALALYTIGGAKASFALDTFSRHLHRGGRDRHPFTQRGARMARAGLRRHLVGSERWSAYIWADESEVGSRRATMLENKVAQLVADVTVLLDLNEGASEDSRRPFGYMQELPYCLSGSRDRSEILGTGCPETCGWGLCPYKQAPVDEPSAQRGVSNAFCRQQRQIARSHKPPWHRRISKRKLQDFWREMEQRART